MTDEPTKQGDSFSVTLTPNRNDISAFILSIEYDSAVITQVKAELTGTSNKDYLTFLNEDGTASLAYTAADGVLSKNGGVILHFRTDSSAASEELSLRFEITDAADFSAESLLSKTEMHTVRVSFPPLPSSDCTLLSLTPPAGTLTPNFDPNIFEYTLEVPFTYTTLTFDAVPTDGASVRVNRKNLSAGGTTVDFNFTVTAADGNTQTVYTVSVTRLKKGTASSEAPAPSSMPVSTDKPTIGSTKVSHGDSPSETGETSSSETASVSNSGSSAAANTTENTAAPNIYIYPESQTDPTVDRLITAAIVLFSVCVGAGVACMLLTHLFKTKDKTDTEDNKNP